MTGATNAKTRKWQDIAFGIFASGGRVREVLDRYGATLGYHVTEQQVLEAVRKGFRAGAGDCTNEVNFAVYNLQGLIRVPD